MNRDGHNNVAFFIGPEVEHTPAFSKKTLFVVGRQDAESIEKMAKEHKVGHIFMGANHSFDIDPRHPDNTLWMYWDKTITTLLDKGYWVTLDYPAHQHEGVLKMLNPGVWQSRMFVPLLSVRIPAIETSSPNLTVKIDDIDFKATNPGVWCMHFREVTDSNRFTDWIEYGTDVVIEQEVSPVVVHPTTPVINETALGLDLDSISKLKPEPDNEETKMVPIPFIASPADAAEAYAEGTISDPLSGKVSKKPKAVK